MRWLGPLLCLPLVLGCDPVEDELLLVGSVERTLVELVAPESEVIIAVHVERGDRVAPGQVLVRLDPTFAAAEIAGSEATLAGARTGELVAEQELARVRKLRRDHVASEQNLDRAKLARDEAAARVREARARLVASRKREENLALASPVAGVVDQLPFDVGERVPAGAVLAVVLEDAAPWVRVWVPESSVVRVMPGTAAEIRIDGIEQTLEGSVLDVAREPEFTPHYALTERDRVHLVYETRVRILEAPESLRAGIPAQVRVLAPDAVARAAE